jgi:hypothetical protein
MVSAAERRWRNEFDAYGLPAAEYVRAWMTPFVSNDDLWLGG